ncbi:sigma-70 family RNA polymerase sigma factor [Streptomyces sp. AV19]|uniref:sigma-70 family RNA polymerase sigma factor n=1 Tax=Streptomyces sp. AV19 TaxID=2793068 RepID=UPI0018FEC784|nr:sigma-70 family RNA polymerase sigma factor [Streptomyces sp. AV19]MBH1936483.1 sigma-70 family RNA polymerase sigma factor [Streptomyces sp. AV19]
MSAVIAETESLIMQRARDYATYASSTDYNLAEDLAQAGRITVWEYLGKFDGETGAQFMAYIDRELHSTMRDQRWKATRPGVTPAAAKDFEKALVLAKGDPYDAARAASTEEMGPRKMSPAHAYAALLSWLGVDSLDRPLNHDLYGDEITLGDVVASQTGLPTELLDATDYEPARRRAIREQVHHALGLLSERQRHILKADYGITPVWDYGEHGSDAELATDMGITPKQVHEARCKAQKRFCTLYLAGAQTW